MKAKDLNELAQFMTASKITNFISCKRYVRVKKAAAYMAKKYDKFLDKNPDESNRLTLMRKKKYLNWKIAFVIKAAGEIK